MRHLARSLLSIDPRTLGATRILLGLLLLLDLGKRGSDLTLWYTNDGLLVGHRLLWRPPSEWMLSYLFALSSREQVVVAFGLTAVVYLCFLLGLRTRLTHVLSWFCLLSLQVRVDALSNGGDFVLCGLVLWTLFLPMGRRFSLDALLLSLRARKEPDAAALRATVATPRDTSEIVSLAVLALMMQLAVIYFFNAVHKTGPTWQQGTAIHYLLHQARIVTAFGVFLREHAPLWLLSSLTHATVVIEYAAPLLILSPFGRPWTRRAAIVLLWGLHASIALVSNLGLFSPTMMVFVSLLVSPQDWALIARRARRHSSRRRLVIDPESPLHLQLARVLSRLDGFGRIEPWAASELTLSPQASAALSSYGFVVLDEAGARSFRGRRAVYQLVRALPLGVSYAWSIVAFAPLLDPPARLLTRRRAQVAAFFGLTPAQAETHPQPYDTLAPSQREDARTPAHGFAARCTAGLREASVLALIVVATSQLLVENAAIARHVRVTQPRALRAAVSYLRLNQGWSMFAPDAPRSDMMVVVDALTEDGRRVDPYNAIASRVADARARALPARLGQNYFFCDYTVRIPGMGVHHDTLTQWIFAYHERTGRAADRIEEFTAYVVEHDSPAPGETAPRNTRHRAFLSRRAPNFRMRLGAGHGVAGERK